MGLYTYQLFEIRVIKPDTGFLTLIYEWVIEDRSRPDPNVFYNLACFRYLLFLISKIKLQRLLYRWIQAQSDGAGLRCIF
jgi:hypothetical protein